MFWPQPAQLRGMTGWCPCWPNDWSPGSGCPGMIISHITEWEAAVRGRGRWPQVPWQPLAPASAPAHETFTSRPWLPHHPHSADSSPLSTLWSPLWCRVYSTLNNSIQLHPFVPPQCRCWQWLSQFYLLFQIRGWVQTSWALSCWLRDSEPEPEAGLATRCYRSCSGARAGSPGSWWWSLVTGPGHRITARHIITRSHDQHKKQT